MRRTSRDAPDTSFFSDGFLRTPPVEGVFEALADCVSGRVTADRRAWRSDVMCVWQVRALGPENVVIVSKAGHAIQEKTMKWLDHHDAFTRTGGLELRQGRVRVAVG